MVLLFTTPRTGSDRNLCPISITKTHQEWLKSHIHTMPYAYAYHSKNSCFSGPYLPFKNQWIPLNPFTFTVNKSTRYTSKSVQELSPKQETPFITAIITTLTKNLHCVDIIGDAPNSQLLVSLPSKRYYARFSLDSSAIQPILGDQWYADISVKQMLDAYGGWGPAAFIKLLNQFPSFSYTASWICEPSYQHIPIEYVIQSRCKNIPLFWSHRYLNSPRFPSSTPYSQGESWTITIIADPVHNLDEAYDEGLHLVEFFQGFNSCKINLISAEIDTQQFLEILQGSHAIHFAGHGKIHPTQGFGWWIKKKNFFKNPDIKKNTAVPRLVTSSACYPIATISPHLPCLYRSFLSHGTHTIIAPTTPIRERNYASYFKRLYGFLLRGFQPSWAYALTQQAHQIEHREEYQFKLIQP